MDEKQEALVKEVSGKLEDAGIPYVIIAGGPRSTLVKELNADAGDLNPRVFTNILPILAKQFLVQAASAVTAER